jgi:hypothetical protein
VASATFGSWTTSAPRGVRQVLAGTDRRGAAPLLLVVPRSSASTTAGAPARPR